MKPDLKQGLQIRTLALYNVRMMLPFALDHLCLHWIRGAQWLSIGSFLWKRLVKNRQQILMQIIN